MNDFRQGSARGAVLEIMARRKAHTVHGTAWRNTAEGHEKYRAARAAAQTRANELGFDHGLRANDLFREWSSFMLPQKQNRYGHETTCEVVMCENLAVCKPGHGPLATRPPSVVGPDHHGGPWVGHEAAVRANRDWKLA